MNPLVLIGWIQRKLYQDDWNRRIFMDMGLQLEDGREVQVWDSIYKEQSDLHGENKSETTRKVSRRQQIRMQKRRKKLARRRRRRKILGIGMVCIGAYIALYCGKSDRRRCRCIWLWKESNRCSGL